MSLSLGIWRVRLLGALAATLWMAVGLGLGVASIALGGNRMALQHPVTS